MESGVPVLATKIEGFDMLIEGETALIVEDSWTEPLRTILQDDDLGTRLGSAATTLVATNYASAAQIAALQAAVTPF
jgi:glycosyltransferase involved in cell wall biosynthesis